MRAGSLRHRITIQRPAATVGKYGAEDGWEDVASVYADIAESAAESGTDRVASTVVISGEIRYREGLMADMAVVWNGVRYHFDGKPYDEDGRRRSLKFRAISVT